MSQRPDSVKLLLITWLAVTAIACPLVIAYLVVTGAL